MTDLTDLAKAMESKHGYPVIDPTETMTPPPGQSPHTTFAAEGEATIDYTDDPHDALVVEWRVPLAAVQVRVQTAKGEVWLKELMTRRFSAQWLLDPEPGQLELAQAFYQEYEKNGRPRLKSLDDANFNRRGMSFALVDGKPYVVDRGSYDSEKDKFYRIDDKIYALPNVRALEDDENIALEACLEVFKAADISACPKGPGRWDVEEAKRQAEEANTAGRALTLEQVTAEICDMLDRFGMSEVASDLVANSRKITKAAVEEAAHKARDWKGRKLFEVSRWVWNAQIQEEYEAAQPMQSMTDWERQEQMFDGRVDYTRDDIFLQIKYAKH